MRRDLEALSEVEMQRISIHSPHVRRDVSKQVSGVFVNDISIHSPHVRRDALEKLLPLG